MSYNADNMKEFLTPEEWEMALSTKSYMPDYKARSPYHFVAGLPWSPFWGPALARLDPADPLPRKQARDM